MTNAALCIATIPCIMPLRPIMAATFMANLLTVCWNEVMLYQQVQRGDWPYHWFCELRDNLRPALSQSVKQHSKAGCSVVSTVRRDVIILAPSFCCYPGRCCIGKNGKA